MRRCLAVAGLAFGVACGGGGGAPASAPGGSSAHAGAASEQDGAGSPKDVDCGDFTTCAVGADGITRCWGRDKEGELGAGPGQGETLKRTAVPGLGKPRKVVLASQFGCALLEDGKVKCWGTGRIANDGKVHSEAPPTAVAGVDGAEELTASGAIACARTPRSVVCWGADDKTIGSPPKGTFKQIAAGFSHACGLDEKGAVVCWGAGDWGAQGAFARPAVSGATQVATGDRHACVLAKDRTVQCWGMNDAGQLGTAPGIEPHKKPAVVPGIRDAVKIAAGEASTCALLADGSVHCWGANGEGELGLGTRSPDERPARVSALSEVEHLCLATAHGCALTKPGKLLCWGSNAFGQLGDGTKERRSAPTAVAW